MSEKVQRAISSGVVVRTQSGYRCEVCDKSLTEVEPHLRGKDHFNNLAWEALRSPAPHPFLLDDIPRVVLEAKQRNELELVDKTVFSYRCLVCPKRPLSNGIRPLETHLKGREHENAQKTMNFSPISPYDPNPLPSAVPHLQLPTPSQASNIQNTQPSFASRNPEREQYQSPPGQHPSHAQAQYPPTDGLQPRYPSVDPQYPSPMHHYNPTPQPYQALLESQYPPINQPPASGGLVGETGPELQRALDEGTVQRGDGQTFKCRVCAISSTGVAPCLEHLRSAKHKKKAQARTQQSLPPNNPPQQQYPASQVQYTTSSHAPASTLPHAYEVGTFRQNSPLPAAASLHALPLSSGGLAGAAGLDPELQRALGEGVMERDDGQGFRCRVCDKNLTGAAPCLEHLRSDRHKGRERTGTQQPLPDFGRLTIRGDQVPGSNFDSLPIGVGRTVDQADGSWVFPWRVMTGTGPFLPSERVYRNLSMPRGLVLIFNYCFPGHGRQERHGAKRDSFNIKTLFHRMGYLVYLYEDLRKSETERALASTQNNPCLKDYGCLIVFILSHGKDDQIFFTASGLEEDCMRLDDVRYRFTDTGCPALKGKPKLFFVNFCRNKRQTGYDGMSPPHLEPLDMMTLYSCINTFQTPRDPELGTFFVQAWCEVLAAHAHDEELLELHFRVSQLMREMNGSVPEQQGYHFKKFYFNPVHVQ
ncbi:uncharacterized protein LOC126995985 isoform X5 [Eriocheir sinensis]|uniref:uncharacterized protein LOC126995985 isoform X3 n=1 Tax=Eriocheir sinensis TaxID=95602 RepID=UPI0021C9C255|nr:uncharacterized protein LOC126995985 isoform X3 [Eriocheir sinensis]XP_050711899.1 uncharacterized protein LOC126995985 isoform X4 [Eriocheir sinensis]XP_050711900.1 uncharacterized protein LOC126995985 isoform X5 [Eriocheir sinensis]